MSKAKKEKQTEGDDYFSLTEDDMGQIDEPILNETESLVLQIEKLKKNLRTCTKERQENLDGWQRTRADYANLKNEFDKKKSEYIRLGIERSVNDILPVVDSFQMAFAQKEVWEKVSKDWRQGIEHIYSQLENVLISQGVNKIDAKNKPFDPSKHEAVENIAVTDPILDGQVLEIIKDGYILNDRVIRPAQVQVGTYNSKT